MNWICDALSGCGMKKPVIAACVAAALSVLAPTAQTMAATSAATAPEVSRPDSAVTDADTSGASADAAAPPESAGAAPAGKSETQNLQEVVVTGNAAVGGVKKLDAAYSVTTLTADQIKQANPVSANDILKASPGIHVESSGGQSGANIEVAGFPGSSGSPFVTIALNGSPLYPVPGLAYLEHGSLLRMDDTIARAEFVQGGPSVLYGNAQPGLFANFILKQGGATPNGSVGLTYGSEGLLRLDGFVSGPLGGSGWYGSIGGFWRKSDGVRDPQYTADKGGQLTATLTHDWDNGSLMLYARVLNDKNQFVTGTPILNPGRGQFSAYPGFDPLTGTMGSKADQYEFLQTVPCSTAGCTPGGIPINMANGRGPDMHFAGANFDWEFGNGWSLSDKLGVSGGTEGMVAFYSTGSNPSTLAAYIAAAATAAGLPAGLVATATYANGGGAADMNQNVVKQELRYVKQQVHSASNELHVSKELFDGNTLTLGNYTAVYSSTEHAFQGSNILLQAVSNPDPIAISLSDGSNTWQLASAQGFTAGPTAVNIIRGNGFNTAFFLSDSWKLDNWLFDAGVRAEHQHVTAHLGNVGKADLDANPYTLYNNGSRYALPGQSNIYYGKNAPAWTVGANYAFTENMSAYVRFNDGVHFPSVTDLTSLPGTPVGKVHNMEAGFKYQQDWIYATLTGYRRLYYGVPTTLLVAVGNTSQLVSYVYGSATNGLNIQATLKPFENFSLTFSGDYQDGQYTHSDGCYTYQGETSTTVCNPGNAFNGNQLARQPVFQARVTPAYTLPTSWGSLSAWLTYEYIGSHYGDQLQLQPLGHYHDWAFGIVADVGTHWQLRLQGTNLTNEIGLTEGNARLLDTASAGGVILARSIEGREVNAQVKYKF
ncbi:MAG: TonB-dependent receptor [Rudaea sp.]|uniref:TonB-dependent receptor n=1 Tax=Rudaea sp. TaxID=2136325 RepID=UPI0039E55DAB